jgi:hypothetical protein
MNNGTLGSFSSRDMAIAALEEFANRKRKRRKDVPPERLRYLAGAVHSLGPRPLFELLRELVAGRDLMQRLERYAQLDADFIRALEGDQLPDGTAKHGLTCMSWHAHIAQIGKNKPKRESKNNTSNCAQKPLRRNDFHDDEIPF